LEQKGITPMEEKRKRKSFDKEFKISAVKMVVEGNQSLSSVARDLGIADNTLQNWKKKYLEGNSKTGEETVVDMAEYKRLVRENRKLREQRDILKKAVAYFSQEEK
jgi:transposase